MFSNYFRKKRYVKTIGLAIDGLNNALGHTGSKNYKSNIVYEENFDSKNPKEEHSRQLIVNASGIFSCFKGSHGSALFCKSYHNLYDYIHATSDILIDYLAHQIITNEAIKDGSLKPTSQYEDPKDFFKKAHEISAQKKIKMAELTEKRDAYLNSEEFIELNKTLTFSLI